MEPQKIRKYAIITEDFFDDANANDIVVQDDEISSTVNDFSNYKFKMCVVLGFNNFYAGNVSDLYDLKKQIIRIIKRINCIFGISPCISSYETEDTNIENTAPENIDYRNEFEIIIHFNTKPRKIIVPFLKFLDTLVYLTKDLSGPKINILGVIIENENDEIDYDDKITQYDFYKRRNFRYTHNENENLTKFLEMMNMMKYNEFIDEFYEYFNYNNISNRIYSSLAKESGVDYVYSNKICELKDYSEISKFCNAFIEIASDDKEKNIFNFDCLANEIGKSTLSTISYMMTYEKKIKTIQELLANHVSDRLKMKITFFKVHYHELHMYITFNKSCKISTDRYYIAPRLFIDFQTSPHNIVKFFKPLFDIGLTDKDCFNIIEDSHILSGFKYKETRKMIQSELKKYYENTQS